MNGPKKVLVVVDDGARASRFEALAPCCCIALTLIVACNDRPFIALPEVAGAATVAAFFQREGTLDVEVQDLSESVRFERLSDSASELTLAFFEATLAELELEPGPLQGTREEVCLDGSLGQPIATYGGRLDDLELRAFAEAPSFVRDFRFERPCPCAELSWRAVPLPRTTAITSLAPAGPNSVFYLLFLVGLVELDLETGEEQLTPFGRSESFTALCSAEPGVVYLAGVEGRFARFTRAGGLELLPLFPDAPQWNAGEIICRRRDDRTEVLLTRRETTDIHLFDGVDWRLVYASSTALADSSNRRTFREFSDGSLFVAFEDAGELVELDADFQILRVTRWVKNLDLDIGAFGGITESTELGRVMFTRVHRVLHRPDPDGAWVAVAGDRDRLAPAPFGILPYRTGALTFGEIGMIREIHPQVGRCPAVTTNLELELERHAVLSPGGQLVLASSKDTQGNSAIIVVNPGP